MSDITARLIKGRGHFLDALAFLSCLAPSRRHSASSLTACVPYFAPVGLALGGLYALPVWAALTFLGPAPFLQSIWPAAALCAWLWLAVEMWSTRALHWDGVADLGDACGSGAQGARFWEILRDSRLGAFGALSLLLLFSGQWLALTWHLAAGHWLTLILAPAWGRASIIWLAASVPAHEPGSLGGLACAGASPALCRAYGLAALVAVALLTTLGLSLWQGAALILAQYCLTRRLAALARCQGGLSGDFLGASVEMGQLCFLLLTL